MVLDTGPTTSIKMGPKKQQNNDEFRIINKKCPYYNRGYCKFGDRCNYKHLDKVCDDINCNEESCDKRHPYPCKFGLRCKLNRKKICLYWHVTFAPGDSKIDALEKKLDKKIGALEKRVAPGDEKMDALEKKLNKKLGVLENRVKEMEIHSENKDREIENIKKKYISLENSFKELQKINIEMEERIEDTK